MQPRLYRVNVHFKCWTTVWKSGCMNQTCKHRLNAITTRCTTGWNLDVLCKLTISYLSNQLYRVDVHSTGWFVLKSL